MKLGIIRKYVLTVWSEHNGDHSPQSYETGICVAELTGM